MARAYDLPMPTDRIEALSRVPMLAGLDRTQLEELAGTFREHEFEAGSTVIREGERGARVVAFFIIVEGRATVSSGNNELAELGPGDHFGEIALVRDTPRRATVTAATGLRCLTIGSWEFRPFVEAHPEIAWRLLETMAERLGEAPTS
jgi:CRP-like cAMP-binding protein